MNDSDKVKFIDPPLSFGALVMFAALVFLLCSLSYFLFRSFESALNPKPEMIQNAIQTEIQPKKENTHE